jgi:hypothetical protein
LFGWQMGFKAGRAKSAATDQRWRHPSMTIELYPFRYRDPLTGRRMQVRYKASG